MLSYHGDAELKSRIVAEMELHKKHDQFVKGTYGKTKDDVFKGCAVGCAINSLNKVLNKSFDTEDHTTLEKELGIPEWLAHLQDTIFENLPNDECSKFAVDFLSSIPVGVNLEPVKWKFCAFLMNQNINLVTKLDINDELRTPVLNALHKVLELHQNALIHNKMNETDAGAAWDAATAAANTAWDAAYAARSADAATRSASYAARHAATGAARSAAYAATAAAAGASYAARSASWSADATISAARLAAASYAARSADGAWDAAGDWSAAYAAWSAATISAANAAWSVLAEELLRLLRNMDLEEGNRC